jgi:NAD(P)-dependent dehydrogenase (short-subunit alcohol dehydrogenase family)
MTVGGDVGDPAVARKVVNTAIERFGRVDTLINNAGIWRPGRIEDIPVPLFREVMRTNLDSVFFATQAAVPAMKRQGGGHIVQISTSLVEHPLQTVPAVLASLSKGAGVAATRGLAMELVWSHIRVNAILLGIVLTPLHHGSDPEDLKSFSPMNRNGEIKDVVRALNYLEDADYVTSEIHYVDGGALQATDIARGGRARPAPHPIAVARKYSDEGPSIPRLWRPCRGRRIGRPTRLRAVGTRRVRHRRRSGSDRADRPIHHRGHLRRLYLSSYPVRSIDR